MKVLKTFYRHQRELEHNRYLQKQKEEAEAYAKMTDEEKKTHDEEKARKIKELNELLSVPLSLLRYPYN